MKVVEYYTRLFLSWTDSSTKLKKIVKVKPLYKQTGVHDRKTFIKTTKTTSYRKRNKLVPVKRK